MTSYLLLPARLASPRPRLAPTSCVHRRARSHGQYLPRASNSGSRTRRHVLRTLALRPRQKPLCAMSPLGAGARRSRCHICTIQCNFASIAGCFCGMPGVHCSAALAQEVGCSIAGRTALLQSRGRMFDHWLQMRGETPRSRCQAPRNGWEGSPMAGPRRCWL